MKDSASFLRVKGGASHQ